MNDALLLKVIGILKSARGGLTSCRDNGDYIPPANPYFFSELDAVIDQLKGLAALRAQPDHSELIAKIDRQERVMREALEALKLEMTQGPLIKECHNAIAAIEKELGE